MELDAAAADLLFREAHTAQRFTDEPVSDDQMRAVWDLIKFAPTSFNTNPLRVLLVRSDQGRARLLPLMAEGNRAKTAAAPLVAVLAADHRFIEFLPILAPFREHAADTFPAADRPGIATLNATLQVAYFIIGVRAAGLGAGPMVGFDAPAVDREFFPDGRWHSLVIVNVGRLAPDGFRPRAPRLDYEQVTATV